MNTEYYKTLLLERQEQLRSDIVRLRGDASASRDAEVLNEIDEVSTSGDKAAALEQSSVEWETLTQVRDALQRIEDGVYGTCIICGKAIPETRLEAVPWTPYCVTDAGEQERLSVPDRTLSDIS